MKRLRLGFPFLLLVVILASGVAVLWWSESSPPLVRADIAVNAKSVERWDTYPESSENRWIVIGKFLGTLRPGMTRAEVETIIGPPSKPRELPNENENGFFLYMTYDCWPPHFAPREPSAPYAFMIQYDANGPVPIFTGYIYQDCTHSTFLEYIPDGPRVKAVRRP